MTNTHPSAHNVTQVDETSISLDPTTISDKLSTFEMSKELLEKGMSVVPLDLDLNAPEYNQKFASSHKFTDKNLGILSTMFPNIGIVTGKISWNLFIVRFYHVSNPEDIPERMRERATWVTKHDSNLDIWFYSGDGLVPNRKMRNGYSIFGHGQIIPFPGCITRDNKMTEWVIRDSQCPPILFKDEIKLIFNLDVLLPQDNTDLERPLVSVTDNIHDHSPELSDFDKAYLICETYPFGKGKTGRNKQLVYRALIDRAVMDKSYTNFRASIREIESVCSVSRASILKYMKEFCEIGLIKLVSPSQLGYRYKLCLKPKFYTTNNNVNNGIKQVKLEMHDIWTSRGFGPCSRSILEKLISLPTDHEGMTVKEIAMTLSLSENTIREKLKQLCRYNFVTKQKRKWKYDANRLTYGHANQISLELGVYGAQQKKKERIDVDRQNHTLFVTRQSQSFRNQRSYHG